MAPRIISTLLPAVFAAALLGLTSCTNKSQGMFSPENPNSIGAPDGGNGGTGIGTPANGGNPPRSTASTHPGPGANDAPEPVPEPGTMFLFGAGLTSLAFCRRRRRAAGETATA